MILKSPNKLLFGDFFERDSSVKNVMHFWSEMIDKETLYIL